jgi:hypothetical protein
MLGKKSQLVSKKSAGLKKVSWGQLIFFKSQLPQLRQLTFFGPFNSFLYKKSADNAHSG